MRHKTNTEFLTDLMDCSRAGPLMQAFILTAIEKYAKMVIANPIEDTPLLSGKAWGRCAEVALEDLNKHLEGR